MAYTAWAHAMVDCLADGQLHKRSEVIGRMAPLVPPNIALNKARRSHPTRKKHLSQEQLITLGQRLVAGTTIAVAIRKKRIRTDLPPGVDRRIVKRYNLQLVAVAEKTKLSGGELARVIGRHPTTVYNWLANREILVEVQARLPEGVSAGEKNEYDDWEVPTAAVPSWLAFARNIRIADTLATTKFAPRIAQEFRDAADNHAEPATIGKGDEAWSGDVIRVETLRLLADRWDAVAVADRNEEEK